MAQRDRDVLRPHRPGRLATALGACACVVLATSTALADDAVSPAAPPAPPPAGAAPAPAEATPTAVVLFPTVTPTGDAPSPLPSRRPIAADGALGARSQELDAALADGVQDLGLTLDLSTRDAAAPARESDLVRRAAKGASWVISPRLEQDGAELVVRIVAVPPGSKIALVRVERVKPSELALRVAVMLRDLVSSQRGRATKDDGRAVEPALVPPLAVPARSQGRATLALNSALFGGFVGYSIQRSSGSDDPRLLYPLMALGTGIGLGGSMIVAEEWDVGIGDAWYLSAGAWWPASAGLLIARGRDVPAADRYSYALIGASGGVGLATLALSFGGIGEGGALFTHSGGAFGTFLGGMTELAARGSTQDVTPYRGMGYGAAAGVLVAGALATQTSVAPSRVLIADLGAGLGGLAGAAATSPFLFGERTEARERTFLVTTMSSTVVGAGLGWLLGRKANGTARLPGGALPYAGVVAESQTAAGKVEPVLGVGVRGAL